MATATTGSGRLVNSLPENFKLHVAIKPLRGLIVQMSPVQLQTRHPPRRRLNSWLTYQAGGGIKAQGVVIAAIEDHKFDHENCGQVRCKLSMMIFGGKEVIPPSVFSSNRTGFNDHVQSGRREEPSFQACLTAGPRAETGGHG